MTVLNESNAEFVGCRDESKKPALKPTVSDGTNAIFNEAGLLISFVENVNPETPTNSLLQLLGFFKKNTDYFNRVCAFGYDINCGLYKRIRNIINNEMESFAQSDHNLIMAILPLMFVCQWHFDKHTEAECELLFNPKSNKFKNILWSIQSSSHPRNDGNKNHCNGEIVEQKWRPWNKLFFVQTMNRRTFNLTMLMFQDYNNEKLFSKLSRQGFKWIPIDMVQPIRDFQDILAAPRMDFPNQMQMLQNLSKAKLIDTDIL